MNTPADQSAATLPVHVLTGFLGSGKTTLLNRLLKEQALGDTAVIVNEFGQISLDHLLVEHSEDNLVELAGGCVCCAVRGDLAVTVLELLERREQGTCAPFERIVVETTGLADPTPIGNLLITDPALAETVHLGTVLTTVDAINGPQTLDNHPTSVRQVALADTLILTKEDLSAAESQALEDRIRQLNPRASIHRADHGTVREGSGLFDSAAARRAPEAFDVEDHHHHHADGIDSFIVRRESPLPGAALGLFLEVLTEHCGADLLRLKGLASIEEAPGQPALIQGAQHVFQPFELLETWPDEDQTTRLVFITQGVSPQWVECLLDALTWEARDTARRLRR